MVITSITLATSTVGRLETLGADLAHSIVGSARYYLDDAEAGRGNWPYPKFRRETEEGEGRRVEISLSLDPELWRRLVIEADRQEISVDRLLEHAALYFAADRESGRVTERILEELG